MITKIIHLIRQFFGLEDIENYRSNPKKSNVQSKSVPQKAHVKKKPHYPVILSQKPKEKSMYVISKPRLMQKIKRNIIFLNQLLEALEGEDDYYTYYKKVKDMKTQSEGSFKIVHRIKDDAPYLQSTLKLVLDHTNTVAKLLEIK